MKDDKCRNDCTLETLDLNFFEENHIEIKIEKEKRDILNNIESVNSNLKKLGKMIRDYNNYKTDIRFNSYISSLKASSPPKYTTLSDKKYNVNTSIPDLDIWKRGCESRDLDVFSWAKPFADAVIDNNAFCMLNVPQGDNLEKYSFFKVWLIWNQINLSNSRKQIENVASMILFEKFFGFQFTNDAYLWVESKFRNQRFVSKNQISEYLKIIRSVSEIKPFVFRKKILSFIINHESDWLKVEQKWPDVIEIINQQFDSCKDDFAKYFNSKEKILCRSRKILEEWNCYYSYEDMAIICDQNVREKKNISVYSKNAQLLDMPMQWENKFPFMLFDWLGKRDDGIDAKIFNDIYYYNEEDFKQKQISSANNDCNSNALNSQNGQESIMLKCVLPFISEKVTNERKKIIEECIADIKDAQKYDRIKMYAVIHKIFFEKNNV